MERIACEIVEFVHIDARQLVRHDLMQNWDVIHLSPLESYLVEKRLADVSASVWPNLDRYLLVQFAKDQFFDEDPIDVGQTRLFEVWQQMIHFNHVVEHVDRGLFVLEDNQPMRRDERHSPHLPASRRSEFFQHLLEHVRERAVA